MESVLGIDLKAKWAYELASKQAFLNDSVESEESVGVIVWLGIFSNSSGREPGE